MTNGEPLPRSDLRRVLGKTIKITYDSKAACFLLCKTLFFTFSILVNLLLLFLEIKDFTRINSCCLSSVVGKTATKFYLFGEICGITLLLILFFYTLFECILRNENTFNVGFRLSWFGKLFSKFTNIYFLKYFSRSGYEEIVLIHSFVGRSLKEDEPYGFQEFLTIFFLLPSLFYFILFSPFALIVRVQILAFTISLPMDEWESVHISNLCQILLSLILLADSERECVFDKISELFIGNGICPGKLIIIEEWYNQMGMVLSRLNQILFVICALEKTDGCFLVYQKMLCDNEIKKNCHSWIYRFVENIPCILSHIPIGVIYSVLLYIFWKYSTKLLNMDNLSTNFMQSLAFG
jgi:hypothetical protein